MCLACPYHPTSRGPDSAVPKGAKVTNRKPSPAPAATPLVNDAERAERFHQVTDILRCKWAVAVVESIAQGHHRPNQIQHRLPGLTNKVLADRLAKLQSFGMVDRTAHAEIPPRVEYTLTPRGEQLLGLIGSISEFVDRWPEGDAR